MNQEEIPLCVTEGSETITETATTTTEGSEIVTETATTTTEGSEIATETTTTTTTTASPETTTTTTAAQPDTTTTTTETKKAEKKTHIKANSITQFRKLDSLVESSKTLGNVDLLVDYLKTEMREYCDSIGDTLRKHHIDAYAFQSMNEAHLDETEMPISIGLKLRLLSIGSQIRRAVRIKRRNHEIGNLTGKIYPPGQQGKIVLTNSCLKFFFEGKNIKEVELNEKRCICFGKKNREISTHTTKMMDHIDLSVIEDIDMKTEEVIVIKTVERALPCLPPKSEETKVSKHYLFLSLALKEEVRSTDLSEKNEFTSMIRVEVKTAEDAKEFKDKLVDAVEEVQFNEGIRYH